MLASSKDKHSMKKLQKGKVSDEMIHYWAIEEVLEVLIVKRRN